MPMTGSDGTWMYGFVGFAAIVFTGCLYLLLDEKKINLKKLKDKGNNRTKKIKKQRIVRCVVFLCLRFGNWRPGGDYL